MVLPQLSLIVLQPPSARLPYHSSPKKCLSSYSQILNNAISADGIVKGKYGENKEGFMMLSKGEADLSSSLPSASPAAALQGNPVVAGPYG